MSSMTGSTGYMGGQQPFKEKIPKGYEAGRIQQFDPQQMDLYNQSFSHLGPGSYLSRLAGGDQSLFGEIEAPAQRQFQEQIGQLGSRFSGMGLGGRKGSGFNLASTQAASNFAQDLQAQRQGLQRQALSDLMGFSNQLLGQRPYENFLTKKQQKKPFWQQLLGAISPIGGDIAEGGTENTQNFFNALSSFGG